MQELINNLYVDTDFQGFISHIIYVAFFIVLAFMLSYFHLNRYKEHNFMFFSKLTLLLLLFIILSSSYVFSTLKDKSYALNVNNKNNYSLVRNADIVNFISNNEYLQNAELKVESENETYTYLEYKNNIFKIPKSSFNSK
jgi:hypothetical protein